MRAKGLHIPAPYFHDPEAVPIRTELSAEVANAKNNAGFWDRLWVAEDGWLMGEITVPLEEDAHRIGTTITGASVYVPPNWSEGGTTWADAITHIALTNKPVITDQAEFQTALALALDEAGEYTETSNSENSSSTSIECVLSILSELGLELPDDTTDVNLMERLCIAGTAVLSHKKQTAKEGASVNEMPKGSKTQKPSPVVMAAETTSVITQLSAELQSLVLGAEKKYRSDYLSRLTKLVERRAVSPANSKKFAEPLVDKITLAFSSDGEKLPNELDAILSAWEDLPDDACLNVLSMSGEVVPRPITGGALSRAEAKAVADEFRANVGLAN